MVCRLFIFCVIAINLPFMAGCVSSPSHPGAAKPIPVESPSVSNVENIAKVAPAEPMPTPNIAAELPVAAPADSVAAPPSAPKPKNVAAVKTAAPSPKPAVVAPVVTLEKLPMAIGAWTLDRMGSQCVLRSPIAQMDDGQGGTPVSIVVSREMLRVHTRSEIDSSYSGAGIAIGNTKFFALEKIDNKTDVIFVRQHAALLGAMAQSRSLTVTLGFWPTWPITHTYAMTFPLQDFATALSAWDTCNRQFVK